MNTEDIKDVKEFKEAKAVGIRFDESSLAIIKRVNPIMRESLINFGLKLASEHVLFSTIFDDTDSKINKLEELLNNNLGIVSNVEQVPTQSAQSTKQATPPPATPAAPATDVISWDSF